MKCQLLSTAVNQHQLLSTVVSCLHKVMLQATAGLRTIMLRCTGAGGATLAAARGAGGGGATPAAGTGAGGGGAGLAAGTGKGTFVGAPTATCEAGGPALTMKAVRSCVCTGGVAFAFGFAISQPLCHPRSLAIAMTASSVRVNGNLEVTDCLKASSPMPERTRWCEVVILPLNS